MLEFSRALIRWWWLLLGVCQELFLYHSLPFTARNFPLWHLLSQARLSVRLVFSGMAAAGAPLGASIGECLLLAPFLCPRWSAICGWCIMGGVQPAVGVFYHRCLGFYLNLGFTLHWAPGPGNFVVVRPGAVASSRLMQSPYILPRYAPLHNI